MCKHEQFDIPLNIDITCIFIQLNIVYSCRYLTTSKLVCAPACNEVPSLYSQQVEGFPLRLAAELDNVSRFIGRLNELSSSRQYAIDRQVYTHL